MFCAIGYRTLKSLVENLNIAAHQQETHSHLGNDVPWQNGKIDWDLDKHFKQDIDAIWLLDAYLESIEYRLFLCSPDGNLLRVDSSLLALTPDAQVLEDEVFETGLRDADIETQKKAYLINGTGRFHFICNRSFTVRLGSTVTESQFETNDELGVFSYAQKEIEGLTSIMENFVGWSVCIQEQDFPDDVEDVVQRFLAQNSVIQKAKSGRPNQQREAWRRYTQFYPNGHEGFSWSAVENKVGFSYKTIQRALAEHGKKSE